MPLAFFINSQVERKSGQAKNGGVFWEFLYNQGILVIEVYAFFILNDLSKVDKDIEPMTSKVVNDGDAENQNKML